MNNEVMRVEEAFLVDMVEIHDYTEEEAKELWDSYKDKIFSNLWDEFSSNVSYIAEQNYKGE